MTPDAENPAIPAAEKFASGLIGSGADPDVTSDGLIDCRLSGGLRAFERSGLSACFVPIGDIRTISVARASRTKTLAMTVSAPRVRNSTAVDGGQVCDSTDG